jgi:hypothetical protein
MRRFKSVRSPFGVRSEVASRRSGKRERKIKLDIGNLEAREMPGATMQGVVVGLLTGGLIQEPLSAMAALRPSVSVR